MGTLEAFMTDDHVPAGALINPLLDVWAAARAMDPAVARPVERLMTDLLRRHLATSDEVTAVIGEMNGLIVESRLVRDAFDARQSLNQRTPRARRRVTIGGVPIPGVTDHR